MKNKDGFSLMETVVYTAIIGSLVTSFVAFGFSIQDVKNKSYVISEVHANTRTSLDFISELIRSSETIISPTKGSQSNNLIMAMPGTSENVSISSTNGVLYYQQGAETEQALTGATVYINNIQFSNLSEPGSVDNISIDVNASSKNNEDQSFDYTFNIKTDVSTRI